MTIERGDYHSTVIECDCVGCNETFEIEASISFERAWPDAKRLGWRAKKIGIDWVHGCPKHANKI